MSLTITIPGAVNVTTGAMAPAVLTIGVGVPGAAGPQGPAGQGVPAGGTAGQFLTKIDGTNYNTDWTTVNLSGYAPLASPAFTGNPTAPTATLGDNDTSIATTAFVQQELLSGTANARNLEVYVRNQTGSTIPAGSIVYINGATGNRPTITLAQANNDANSAQTFGFTKASIANNGFGFVIVRGELENVDTSALTEGVQLYLSPTTPGTWTTTKPAAPQHLVYVGIVVRAHPTQGVILVAVQNGYELPELHDVSITSVTNNDLLTYESSSTLWKNKSIGTLGLATQSYVAAGFAPIGAGLPVSGTVGQVLTKNSGTNYDASWATLVPGDRYLTTSTTSNTIGTGSKTFMVGTGLSYSSQQDVVISFDATNHMHALVTSYNSGTGALVVNVQSVTGSGTYTAWTVNVGGTTPLQSVEWGEILGVLGDQSDLATALGNKLETSTAASTYAALAGATFTGEVILPASNTSTASLTITPGVAPTTPTNGEIWATTNDLQVRLNGVTETVAEQSWVTAGFYPLSGNPSGFLVSSALTPYALLSGATFTGLVTTPAATTTTAGLNVPHGAAPTTPVNGDIWTTTGGIFWRQNGSTKQAMNLGDTQTVSGNITFSNGTLTLGSSTGASTYNLGSGATTTGITKAINIGTAGASGSTTNITVGPVAGTSTTSIGNTTAASTLNLATGATLTATTKAVNIGTSGVAGSTTNIAIGSTTGTSTTTLQGATNGVTVAADTNSVALATTAYVVGQAGSATPLVNGTAAVGTSLRYARQDHVHPTDTSRAALNSPAFTGTPSLPTGTTAVTQTAGNNTTAVATTAFVLANAGTPSFAGVTNVNYDPTSTTLALNPSNIPFLLANANYRNYCSLTASSINGSAAVTQFGSARELYTSSSTASGRATWMSTAYGAEFGNISSPANSRVINWSKRLWVFGVAILGRSTFVGNANTVCRVNLGGRTLNSTGDLTTKGIGLFKVGGTSTFVNLTVHNGTTLTNVATSVTVASDASIHYMIYSDGAGNVQLYLNGTLAASTSAGPTGDSTAGANVYEEQIEAGASSGTQSSMHVAGAGVYIQR